MVVFPNAKINIGLNILRKRNDGFHDIESVMYPIGLRDVLEIVPAKDTQHEKYQFTQTGLEIDGAPEQNLCVKAYKMLDEAYHLPKVKIHLHKHIPFGAGLGGGSADATFTLTMLNGIFSLGLDIDKLKLYAEKLGSDCPFFVENTPAFVTGRGEVMEPVLMSLRGYFLFLVTPDIHVSTAQAYAGVVPHKAEYDLRKSVRMEVDAWKNKIKNAFEPGIFSQQPRLKDIKEKLYQKGALYASMTGSGSSVFGIFSEPVRLEKEFQGLFTYREML